MVTDELMAVRKPQLLVYIQPSAAANACKRDACCDPITIWAANLAQQSQQLGLYVKADGVIVGHLKLTTSPDLLCRKPLLLTKKYLLPQMLALTSSYSLIGGCYAIPAMPCQREDLRKRHSG